jgi:protein TonB
MQLAMIGLGRLGEKSAWKCERRSRRLIPKDRRHQAAAAAPAAPAAPKTVAASQLGYLVPPNPIYPARARKAGEQGNAVVRVLADVTGRPAQVSLQTSSGHPELDQSALSAVRAAQFRPYTEGGLAQAVWVLVPINFVLR